MVISRILFYFFYKRVVGGDKVRRMSFFHEPHSLTPLKMGTM
jgi:hypothetical protein